MAKGFIKLPNDRGFVTIPAIIFEDERVSLGAKGLYAQLYYSNQKILCLEDLVELTSSTKEEIESWFMELNKIGYLSTTKTGCTLNIRTQGEKTVARKLDEDAINDKMNAKISKESLHDRIGKIIDSFDTLDSTIKNLLIEFFDNWSFRKGRYSETSNITETRARALINELIGFNLSNDEMADVVRTSINKEYFQFVNPNSDEPKPEIPIAEVLKKITGIVTVKYKDDFPQSVQNKLIEYYTKWLNKEGRFEEAETLHGPKVHSMLIELRSFKMTEQEMLDCVQNSMDKEYFKFIDNRQKNTTTTNTAKSAFKPFDKANITSGSYTTDDIEQIKARAKALESDGKKGIF